MIKNKKIVCSILVLVILIYYVLGMLVNNITYAATTRKRATNLDDLTESKYPAVATLINELKKSHPNWTFTILYTGLNWNDVIYNETEVLHGRSLVQNSSAEWRCPTCKGAYDNGSWYCASKQAVSYYMDVRNWITESNIFAFEALSYDSATQTIDGVNKILAGTFMDKDVIKYKDKNGNVQTINKSYAQIIMEAAKESGVSPYHLASRLKQEQGTSGTSGLISGSYTYTDSKGNLITELKGYYNYFNIRASGGSTAQIIKNGLTHAKSKGWTNPELAIKGGATFLAGEYISDYQDCLYLEKYQVDSAGGLYSHQYMQNISAPFSEGYETYEAYKDMGMLNCSFNFIIPVYENMPKQICLSPNAVEMNIVTENVKVTTSYSDLKVRATPASNGTLVGSLKKGTVVLRIEKAKSMSGDGRYWDKIAYDTGSNLIVGYAARTDTDGSLYLTNVADVTTTSEKSVTTTEVNLRNGPGTSGTTAKKTLPANTNVIIIDKMKYKINDYCWYRVKLEDGTQGYVASIYLKDNSSTKPPEPTEPVEPEPPKAENYKIEGNNLIITPGTKIADIEGATLEGTILGTGAKITLSNNKYTLVVLGDVSGDGEVDARDSARVLKFSIGQYSMNEEQKKAADISKDTNIDARDSARILKFSINEYDITL